MSKEAIKLEKIMEQAQVFASAWSLVGGRFDSGNMLDEAEGAKSELRQMVAEALAEQPAQQEPFGYFKAEPFGWTDCAETDEGAVALYERPPSLSLAQRQARSADTWVGLTDEERDDLLDTYITAEGRARAIEAKLKEKNT